MQALKVLVVVMGVLIAAGVAVVVATIVSRMSHTVAPAGAGLRLDEPVGTHIGAASLGGGTLAVTLVGGGPDRVVVLDLNTGRVLRKIELAK